MMYTPQPAVLPSAELAPFTVRRYDSAGVCIDGTAKRLVIAKATGKVDVLAELANARVNDDITCPGDEVTLAVPPPMPVAPEHESADSVKYCSLELLLHILVRPMTASPHHTLTIAAAQAAC